MYTALRFIVKAEAWDFVFKTVSFDQMQERGFAGAIAADENRDAGAKFQLCIFEQGFICAIGVVGESESHLVSPVKTRG